MRSLITHVTALPLVTSLALAAGCSGDKGDDHSKHDHGSEKSQSALQKQDGKYDPKPTGEKSKDKMSEGKTLMDVTCPVSNDQAVQEITTDHNGKKVYFCCEDCIDSFKKNPAKYGW